MIHKILPLLALLCSPCLRGQTAEDTWVCPGSEVTLNCPGDSLNWFLVENTDTLFLDVDAIGLFQNDEGLVISEFPGAWLNHLLLSRSIAAEDSGEVVCSFLFQEFVLEPSLSVSFELDELLCVGDSAEAHIELPLLPDTVLEWLSVGTVNTVGEEIITFSDSVSFEVNGDASIMVTVTAEGAQCPNFELTGTVGAFPDFIAPQIQMSEESLCLENDGVLITRISEASGGQGTFGYTWQRFEENNWQNLGATDSLLTGSLVPGIHEFRCRATNACGDVFSEAVAVEVFQALQAPLAAISNDSLCAVNEGVELSLVGDASGGGGEFEYFWDQLVVGQWEELAAAESFGTGTLLPGLYSYRLRTASYCGISTSSLQTVLIYDELEAPIIQLSSSDTLCFENEGAEVHLVGLPSGGAAENDIYWMISNTEGESQLSDNEGLWTVNALASNTAVQYVNQNDCGVTESNEVVIEVLEPFLGAEILTNLSSQNGVCYGSEFETFHWNSPPTGGANQYNVVWTALMEEAILQSQSGGESFTIQSSAEQELQVQLSVVDALGCGQSLSALDVEVYDPIVAPVIYSTTPDTVCAQNEGLAVFVGVAPSGGVSENLTLWNVGQEGEVAQYDLESYEDFVLDELESTLTMWMTNENLCANTQSDSLTFEVLPEMVAPVIVTSQELFPLCFGDDSPAMVVDAPPLGATDEWSLQWIQTAQSQGAVVAESLDSFILPSQTDSSTVVLFAESLFGCGTLTSNAIDVPVLAELVPGVLSSSQLICYDSEPEVLTASPYMGGSGDVEYQWQFTQENSSSTLTTPGDSFGIGPLVDTMVVVLEVVDLYGCGSVLTNEVVIDVLPNLEEPSIEVTNSDTLCWMDGIGLSAVGFSAYPWLDLQWTSSPDQSEVLSGAQDYVAEVSQLDSSTVFSLMVSSSYGCGSVEVTSYEVPVYEELLAGEIGYGSQPEFETSFCFGDTLGEVFNVEYPQGGSLQWQIEWLTLNQDGQELILETASDSLSPFVLDESVEIVRRTTDLLGCGTLLSNVIEVAVYDSLAWEMSLTGTELCDGEAFSSFSVLGAGGGGVFDYSWQSSDSSSELNQINTGNLSGLVPNESTMIWVQATSLNGCGDLFSDTVDVFVADPLLPADISAAVQEICSGESVLISTEESATGGLGAFTLEWLQEDATGIPTDSGEMSPDILVAGDDINIVGFQRATNECGSVNSDTVSIVVNPLPEAPSLSGNFAPCLGSTNQSYTLSSGWWLGLDYDWDIQGGQITSGETGPNLLVNWDFVPGAWGIEVELTYLETGCKSDHTFEVNPSENAAPPISEVFKKLGQDILISADSSDCAQYQWGAIDIVSGEELIFSEQNSQYIILSPLDTEAFHYFVDVTHSCEGYAGCPTRNFYVHVPFVSVAEIGRDVVAMFPNPTLGQLRIAGLEKPSDWKLYSTSGALLEQGEVGLGEGLDFSHLSSGFFLLHVAGHSLRLQILN